MSGQKLTLTEQETSSSQAPYPSLPPFGESSLIPLLLLSPQSHATLRGPLCRDNGTDTAEVYTHDARLVNKLRELSQKSPEDFVLVRSGPGRSVTYRLPKRCVGIRPPYSEERRQRQRQYAKENGLPFLRKEEQNV